jgi:hypothetical protein
MLISRIVVVGAERYASFAPEWKGFQNNEMDQGLGFRRAIAGGTSAAQV